MLFGSSRPAPSASSRLTGKRCQPLQISPVSSRVYNSQIFVVTAIDNFPDRLRSYQLLAEEMLKNPDNSFNSRPGASEART